MHKNTDPWYSAYHYTHPTLVERLRAIEALEKIRDSKKDKKE